MEWISLLPLLALLVSIEGSGTYFRRFASRKGNITNIDEHVFSPRDKFVCALSCCRSESCQLFSLGIKHKLCTLHLETRFGNKKLDGRMIWVKTAELGGKHGTSPESSPMTEEELGLYSVNITLHQACKEGKLDVVKYILTKNPTDINSPGYLNRTPVMMTARKGHLDVFNHLVKKGCDMSLFDDRKENVFHMACVGGNTEIVKIVLAYGIFNINVKGYKGKTGLLWAAFCGNRDVVELLERKVCDMKAVDKYGSNVLHHACLGGHVNMVEYILSKRIVSIDSKGHYLKTPVMMASEMNHTKIVFLLVKHGCDLTEINQFNYNVLHLVCIYGYVELVRYFLSLDGESIESIGASGNTPVMIAADEGQLEVVKFLVHKGCILNRVNVRNDTILHLAVVSGRVDVVDYILSRKVIDIDMRGFRGCTAVMTAAEEGHSDVLQFLVRKRCKLSITGYEHNTVLHSACIGGNLNIVKYLLNHLSSKYLRYRNKYGRTPIQVARFMKRKAVVDYLRGWE